MNQNRNDNRSGKRRHTNKQHGPSSNQEEGEMKDKNQRRRNDHDHPRDGWSGPSRQQQHRQQRTDRADHNRQRFQTARNDRSSEGAHLQQQQHSSGDWRSGTSGHPPVQDEYHDFVVSDREMYGYDMRDNGYHHHNSQGGGVWNRNRQPASSSMNWNDTIGGDARNDEYGADRWRPQFEPSSYESWGDRGRAQQDHNYDGDDNHRPIWSNTKKNQRQYSNQRDTAPQSWPDNGWMTRQDAKALEERSWQPAAKWKGDQVSHSQGYRTEKKDQTQKGNGQQRSQQRRQQKQNRDWRDGEREQSQINNWTPRRDDRNIDDRSFNQNGKQQRRQHQHQHQHQQHQQQQHTHQQHPRQSRFSSQSQLLPAYHPEEQSPRHFERDVLESGTDDGRGRSSSPTWSVSARGSTYTSHEKRHSRSSSVARGRKRDESLSSTSTRRSRSRSRSLDSPKAVHRLPVANQYNDSHHTSARSGDMGPPTNTARLDDRRHNRKSKPSQRVRAQESDTTHMSHLVSQRQESENELGSLMPPPDSDNTRMPPPADLSYVSDISLNGEHHEHNVDQTARGLLSAEISFQAVTIRSHSSTAPRRSPELKANRQASMKRFFPGDDDDHDLIPARPMLIRRAFKPIGGHESEVQSLYVTDDEHIRASGFISSKEQASDVEMNDPTVTLESQSQGEFTSPQCDQSKETSPSVKRRSRSPHYVHVSTEQHLQATPSSNKGVQRRFIEPPTPTISETPEPDSSRSTNERPKRDRTARIHRREGSRRKSPHDLEASASNTPLSSEPQIVPKPVQGELFAIINQVGEGTFGKVYKARNTASRKLVALKRIRMESEKDGFPVTAMREIKLLQSLRHENVICLYEMMVSHGSVYMVFEYMDHDLTGILQQTQFMFTDAHLKSFCQQMLAGLAYLHHKAVIHRDIKGSNILINHHGELKLADFGLARFYQKRRQADYTNRVITLWYRPPELLLGATVYGPEVDLWSAGCIMLELFTKKPVFQGNDDIHQLDVIYKILGTPTLKTWPDIETLPWYELVKPSESLRNAFRDIFAKWLSPAGLDLAERLLAYSPSHRVTAVDALQMPYFVVEDPPAIHPVGLDALEGEWHEFEYKQERERARKRRKLEAGSAQA